MVTFPTPLYFNKIVHIENAAADIKPEYKSKLYPFIVEFKPLTPPKNPINIKNKDPINNWYPEIVKADMFFAILLVYIPAKAPTKLEITTNPSPVSVNPL